MKLQARLADVAAAVAEARRAVDEGAAIDVAGLDTAVSEICDAAPGLASTERADFARDLAALADALDGLAAAIARQGEAVQRRRASAAYSPEGPR